MPYDVIHRSQRTKACFAQGDMHDAYSALGHGTFDLVILCAEELDDMFHFFFDVHPQLRKRAVFAPNDDGALNRKRVETALRGAKAAASAYKRGQRVLITCAQGRNRSGLVSAIALHLVSGISGEDAIDIVRGRRVRGSGPALTNEHFVKFLLGIRERPGARGHGYLKSAAE